MDEVKIQEDASARLQFQDFSLSSPSAPARPVENQGVSKASGGQTHNFTSFPDSAVDDDDGSPDGKDSAGGSTGTSKFWTLSFYQQFFDVDTDDVMARLMWSMVPRPSTPFLQQFLRPKPDLYGPVWVGFTLVFFIAIMGNVADYLATAGAGSHWKYDFQKVSISGTCIFLYGWVLPVMLWGFLWWKQEKGVSLLELLCLYGYSLAIYIPVSMLWAIPVPILQWILVFGAAALSGAVLVIALGHALRDSSEKIRFPLLIVVLGCHLVLAAGLQLYFFRASSSVPVPQPSVNVTKRSEMPLGALRLEEPAVVDKLSNGLHNPTKSLPSGNVTFPALREESVDKAVKINPKPDATELHPIISNNGVTDLRSTAVANSTKR